MSLTRRKFLGLSAGAVAGGVFGRSLYEPHELVVSQVGVALKRLPPGFGGLRIAQVSDIHFNSFMTADRLDRVVGLVNSQKPDVVILTGDYVTAGHEDESGRERNARAEHAWPCANLLRRIESPLGCFAVLGNHDCNTNAALVVEALSAGSRIQVLRNRAIALERNGARLWLAGVDDVTAGSPRLEVTFRGIPKQECTVVAVHEPDIADDMRDYPVDFQMSGHSHGGQIRFPGIGALYLPPWARKYPMGHYRIGEMQLYTNRGIGELGLPMRFMCPPEITIFTLQKAT